MSGASGTSTMIAPPPTPLKAEFPYALLAIKAAFTYSPNWRSNGLDVNTFNGMVHYAAFNIVEFDPSQLESCSSNPPEDFCKYTL